MLRTNPSFLSYIEDLYQAGPHSGDIALRTFPVHSLLLKQQVVANRVLIIKEGITKCFFTEDNGKDYVFEFLSAGEIVGEIEVIKGIPCLCNVEALTQVQAYAIDLPFFRSLLDKDLALNKLLLETLASRIVNTSSRSALQQLNTIESGLKKMMTLQDKLHITIAKEDMAAYLGVTLRSLNRALKKLR